MTKFAMLLSLAATALGSQPAVVLAQAVPTFDVRTTCRGEAQGDPSAGAVSACLADEQEAREALVAQWSQFAPRSKSTCMGMATGFAGVRSYVELLTCLQIAKDTKGLPEK